MNIRQTHLTTVVLLPMLVSDGYTLHGESIVSRGVATGVYGYIYPPPPKKKKTGQVNLLWGKNDVRTAIEQFYTPKKLLYPKNNFLATPLIVSYVITRTHSTFGDRAFAACCAGVTPAPDYGKVYHRISEMRTYRTVGSGGH